MIPDLVVCTSVEGDVLTGVIAMPAPQRPDVTFAFYLLRDGEIIWRSKYGISDRVYCQLDTPGTYELKAFIKDGNSKKTHKSNPLTYSGFPQQQTEVSEYQAKGFNEFIDGQYAPLPLLPFVPLEYPHQDFAIFTKKDSPAIAARQGLATKTEELGLRYSEWPISNQNVLHIISSHEIKQGTDDAYLFSGMTRNHDRFIFGSDDLVRESIESILDQIGDCTLARLGNQGVVVTTDYFGIGKIYYYSKNGVTCVTNRYHLLLIVLKAANVRLQVNTKKALGSMSALSQPFMQNFSREMDVSDCFTLPVGTGLEIRDGKLHLHKTDLSSALNSERQLTTPEYSGLVNQAAEEIIDNLRIVLKHPRFQNVRVDLTGGMDARMVFAALTHLTEYRNKIHIHTADMPGSPEDLQISLALTELCEFKYDQIPRTTKEVGRWDTFMEILSLDLGTYYGRKPVAAVSKLDDSIRVNGFYGEICARPYYARPYFNKGLENLSISDLSMAYVSRIDESLLPLGEPNILADILETELSLIPGRNSLEKLDHHYLYYRNGLHCTDRWLSRTLASGWGPLQSKYMFNLKHATFVESKDIRVQLDVTSAINSRVAGVPYGRNKDNLERKKLAPYLLDSDFYEADMPTSLDPRRHRDSAVKRAVLTRQVSRPDAHLIQTENNIFNTALRQRTFAALHSILSDRKIFDRAESQHLYESVIARFDSDDDAVSDKTLVLVNKIFSLYYQLELIS